MINPVPVIAPLEPPLAPAEPARPPHLTSPNAERRGLRYMCWFLLLPVLGYFFPFFAERVPPFRDMSATYGGTILDHGHGLAGVNADVVFFGDSTAMFGVDAVRMSHQLGVKVLILPNSLGSLANTEDWVLREYVASNKPPRLIVFQTAPWNMDFHQIPNPAPYEGDEEVVRHADLREFARFLWTHPDEVFYFPFRFYATPTYLTRIGNWGRPNNVRAHVEQGFTPNPSGISLPPKCELPDFEVNNRGTGSVRALLQKYRTAHTKTIVYLSPIPACRNIAPIVRRRYTGLDVAPPVVIPPEYFSADFTSAHPLFRWVAVTTDFATKVVRQALRQPD